VTVFSRLDFAMNGSCVTADLIGTVVEDRRRITVLLLRGQASVVDACACDGAFPDRDFRAIHGAEEAHDPECVPGQPRDAE
jgi:hypothetical protein